MIDSKAIDDMVRRISDSLPSGVKAFQEDIEKNIRATLHGVFERMDLVTREEFDVQMAVLERTRERVMELESQVRHLEEHVGIRAVSTPEETDTAAEPPPPPPGHS